MAGSHHTRLEDPPLLTGSGRFVADLITEETLHCVFVRSPVAHAEIVEVDIEDAENMPGVVTVAINASLGLSDMPPSAGGVAEGMDRPFLARDRVRFVGEAVAAVVADTPQQAADAAERVWVEYGDLSPVMDSDASIGDEVLLFPRAGTNVALDQARQSAGFDEDRPPDVTSVVEVPRVAPVSIETMSIMATPVGDDLVVHCGHQSLGRLRSQLAAALEMNPDDLRVVIPDVGGAFGMKNGLYPEFAVTARLAQTLQRQVVWVQTRSEQFLMGTHGRGQTIRVSLSATPDGRLTSADIEITADIGAYPHRGAMVPLLTGWVSQGPYRIPELRLRALAAVTNKAPTGPYRGAGRPEAAIAMERAMDALAVNLSIAPDELRRRNFIPPESIPFTAHSGAVYDSGDYSQALDTALAVAEVDRWREEQAQRRADGDNPIGIGIGCFVERAGGSLGSGEYGRVDVTPGGDIIVRTGSTGSGQGHPTVWSSMAAEVFGVTPGSVRFLFGDSQEIAQSVGTFGSRSAQAGASAIAITARRVADQVKEVAASMLEASPADLELSGGQVRVKGSPGSELSLADVARAAEANGHELSAEEMFVPDGQTFPYGCYVAVVEVDLETGQVSLLSLTAVDDCGVVLSPMIVEGQLHGSVMQGLGTALLEHVVYDGQGNLLTGNLTGYLIPDSEMDLHLRSHRLSTPAPSNPLGVKGTGEAGCLGVPAAMLNAAYDALQEVEVGKLNLPLTPSRVWEAISNPTALPGPDVS